MGDFFVGKYIIILSFEVNMLITKPNKQIHKYTMEHFRHKAIDIENLKRKMFFHGNIKHKKAEVTLLMSEKVDFKQTQ